MESFTTHHGLVAPMKRANVDTDQIIPKQFLKSIRRTGFGDNLFDAWRYHDEGDLSKTANEREINHDFILNQARYESAGILGAGDNFGCRSSREHAVWAIQESGFRCVIAPTFADIFFNNSIKNGLLLIRLDEATVNELMATVEAAPGLHLTVDLVNQTINGDGVDISFEIEAERKKLLLEGLDDIGLTLGYADQIRAFEVRHREAMPWVFGGRS